MFSDTAKPSEERPSRPGLLLRVGSSRYRVLGAAGSEIAPCPALATVPGAPHWLVGIGLHKGTALAVIHLHALLEEQPRERPANARLLVTQHCGAALAYLVDDVDADAGQHEVPELDLLAIGRVLMTHAFLSSEPQ